MEQSKSNQIIREYPSESGGQKDSQGPLKPEQPHMIKLNSYPPALRQMGDG